MILDKVGKFIDEFINLDYPDMSGLECMFNKYLNEGIAKLKIINDFGEVKVVLELPGVLSMWEIRLMLDAADKHGLEIDIIDWNIQTGEEGHRMFVYLKSNLTND
jgi:hypothetical protein